MKPKSQIDLDAAGEEVKRLLAEDGTASAELKDMRGQKLARKEAIKKVLTIVWKALEAHKPVNGYTDKGAWAKEFAGRTARWCQHQVYGRKSNGNENRNVRSHGFLSRIADVKKKLTDIQSQIDSFYEGGESCDVNALQKQINPTIDPLFEEFLKLITPDGCEVMPIGNHNWHVQAYGQPTTKKPAPKKKAPTVPAVTHIKVSARKTLCMTRFVNRKFKGTVFAKNGEAVTCPECVKVRDGQLGGGTLQRVRDEKSKKEEVRQPATPKVKTANMDIRIKLTSTQFREAGQLARDLGVSWSPKVTLVFQADEYQSQAKKLVEALERRIADLTAESKALRKTMSDWNDKSPENVAKFKEHAGIDGAIKACNAAIREITFGDVESDDPARNIREWHEQRHDERPGLSEPAKALDATVDGAELTWAQKVVIPGSPERLQWAADLKKRRENPPYDPNEDEDCEEDCPTEEDSEEEVV